MAFDISSLGAIALGGLLGSQSGSSQSGTSTSTTAPWEAQQPYLKDLYSRASALMNQPASSALQNQALSGMQSATTNPLTGQAQGVISNTLNQNPAQNFGIGQRVQIGENPYLTGGMDNPYLKQSVDNASESAMRNLNSNMAAANHSAGSFGNSGVAETYGRAAGDQLGQIANNAYMNQFNTNLGMTNSNNLAQAQLNQTGLNNDISQFNQGQSTLNNAAFNAPQFNSANANNYGALYNAATMDNNNQWNPLKNYGSLITSGGGSQSTSPVYSNPYAGAIGGAMAGSSIYNSLFK